MALVNVYFDIECTVDFFLAVFEVRETEEIKIFEISMFKNELKELKEFSKTIDWYIGYNSSQYDCPFMEFVLKQRQITAQELYQYSVKLIASEKNYTRLKCLDLMELHNFGPRGRSTSLKKLMFFFRRKNIEDSPYSHLDSINTPKKAKEMVSYCIRDVSETKAIHKESIINIKQRIELSKVFNLTLYSLSDPSMGEKIILNTLRVDKSAPLEYDIIHCKDVILSKIKETPLVKIAKEYFNQISIKKVKDSFDFKKDTEAYDYSFRNATITWGMGGIHGIEKPGIYKSDEEYIIKTCDVTSEYPSFLLNNNLYPKKCGPGFCKLYRYFKTERAKHPKKTPLNLGFKLLLNLVYGKLNNSYSCLYDPKLLCTVTINCQLYISWLVDVLSELEPQYVEINTDGITIRIRRSQEERYMQICREWERETGFDLEYGNYELVAIRDVNNYIAKDDKGEIKRKGVFVTRDDMLKLQEYHKDSSANIIPILLTEYFINNIHPEDKIKEIDDIFEYLYGYKGEKGFDFLLMEADEKRRVTTKRYHSRLFRYYVSPEGATLAKLWVKPDKIKIDSIHKDCLIKKATKITAPTIKMVKRKVELGDTFVEEPNYTIDYDWYISEVYKIINAVEENE